MRFLTLLWIWLTKYDRFVYGNVQCGSILEASLLPEAGTFEASNFTSLHGVITLKMEGILVGVLEFLVENEKDQSDRSGGEEYVILRMEFYTDIVVLSSSIGANKYEVLKLDLMSNRAPDSVLTFQLLGSDEVANKGRLKVYGNAFHSKAVNNYPFSTDFLEAGKLSVHSKIKRIRKTVALVEFNYCSTSYPEIVCESNSYDEPGPEEFLMHNHGVCVEKLVINSEESRELKCVGHGAPEMNASWSVDGTNLELVDTGSVSQTSCNDCYEFVTTRNVSSRGGLISNGEVSCEIWNKNFDFPHRFQRKRFVITFEKMLTEPKTTVMKHTTAVRVVTNLTELPNESPTKTINKTSTPTTERVTSTNKDLPTFSSQPSTLTSGLTTSYSYSNTANGENPTLLSNSTDGIVSDNSSSDFDPNLHKPLTVSVYILGFLLVSGVMAAFCVISVAAMRKHHRQYQVRRVNRLANTVPKIAQPPVPKSFDRQATASTMVSSSVDENIEMEHIYATVDETQDPAYCYAWTVSPEVLRNSNVDVKFVLTPTSSRFSRQSSGGDGYPSTLSQSTSGASGNRTYSNTGLCSLEECLQPETLPVILVNGVEVEVEDDAVVGQDLNLNVDNTLTTRRTTPYPQRHAIRSEYISLAMSKALHPGVPSLIDSGKTSLNEVIESKGKSF